VTTDFRHSAPRRTPIPAATRGPSAIAVDDTPAEPLTLTAAPTGTERVSFATPRRKGAQEGGARRPPLHPGRPGAADDGARWISPELSAAWVRPPLPCQMHMAVLDLL